MNQPRQCGAVANRSVRHVKGPSNEASATAAEFAIASDNADDDDNDDDDEDATAGAEADAKASGSGLSCGGIETRADARLRTVLER